jgi:hypothetical protein
VVGVSRSVYYEYKYHVPSDREIRRVLLSDLIADIHARSRGTYGILRVRRELCLEHNMIVNGKLIRSITCARSRTRNAATILEAFSSSEDQRAR